MPQPHEVHRFRIPVMGGHIDLRLRRVGERQFQAVGTLVVSKSLRFKFRAAGDLEVDVVDPTGLLPQALTIWPQVVQFLRTAGQALEGAAKAAPGAAPTGPGKSPRGGRR